MGHRSAQAVTVGAANETCVECGLYSFALDTVGRCPRCVSGVAPMNEAQLAYVRLRAGENERNRQRDADRRRRDAVARQGGRRVRRFG